jgi:hypothetical protein
MCVIQISVQCSENFSELMIDNVQDTELIVESRIGTALLELFDTVYIEDVRLLMSEGDMENREGDDV